MKVLSVQQPFATLLALGLKGFETRSWATKHRGETAIHASKKMNKAIRDICDQEPFKSVLVKYGFTADNLPLGKIIAIGNLTDCFNTNPYGLSDYVELTSDKSVKYIEGLEFAFGDFTRGRFAWEMVDMKQIEPIPAKGQLSLWNWEGEYKWTT